MHYISYLNWNKLYRIYSGYWHSNVIYGDILHYPIRLCTVLLDYFGFSALLLNSATNSTISAIRDEPVTHICILYPQLDNAKAEVGRKDTELLAVKTQMEALQRQHADHQHHITVLKEQVIAKEGQYSEHKAEVIF